MKGFVILLCSALPLFTAAQLDVPVRIIFDGDTPEKRQVVGLADPIAPDAAVSVDAYRRQVVNRATLGGDSLMLGSLFPAPSTYTAGMVVTLTPLQANRPNAELDLNGLGPRPIVKWGGLPLDSADLHAGVPVRLVYDGERFQLIGSTTINCPLGYTAGSTAYCIEDSSRAATTWYEAVRQCDGAGGRLCTFLEWTQACYRFPGFFATVPEAEWLDHAANHTLTAKVVGHGNNGIDTTLGSGCHYGSNRPPGQSARFRCCISR